MRAIALCAVLLAASCTTLPPAVPTPTPSPESGVLDVTALLDLSGPRSPAGTAQRDALQLWLDRRPANATPKVRLRTVDVASSDARMLIELRRAAVEERADAVIVGAPLAYDDTLAEAFAVAELPILLTLPISGDPAPRPGGRWTFALAPSLETLAARALDAAGTSGSSTPALVLSDGALPSSAAALALRKERERRSAEPITTIVLPADGSIPPVVRSSLSVLRSVHCVALPATCANVARMAGQSGSSAIVYLPYAATPSEVAGLREIAAQVVWPGSRFVASPLPVTGTPYAARVEFARGYTERHGPPATSAASAFDALQLLAVAAERAGADDRERLRGALEATTLALIATTYDFSPLRHSGFDGSDLTYLRWNGSSVTAAAALPARTLPSRPSPSPIQSPTPTP